MENHLNENVLTEASLTDSITYRSFNNNAEMTTMILAAIKDSIVIESSYIEEQVIQIKRTKISPLAEKVLKAYEDGEIVLLYAVNKRVPKVLPFFATKMQGKIKVFIFVNNYGTISKSDIDSTKKYLNISMKDLYVLMEGAYIAHSYAVYPTIVTKSLGLMKVSCAVYTAMITRILNKECSISMDGDLYSKTVFCIGKFFLERVWMTTNKDIIFNYACNNIRNAINKADMLVVSDIYDAKNIQTVDQLIDFLKELSPRFNAMSFRYFIQCYINTYKDGALFSLECLPYFLFTVVASLLGCFLVNQPIISDVCKNTKGMNTFYPELVKCVS